MKLKAELIISINGKEVYKGRSKSFVANFAKLLLGILSAPGYWPYYGLTALASATVTLPSGSATTVPTEFYNAANAGYGGGTPLAINAPDNEPSYGIVVGSGSTPVSPTDYNLASQIPHGTGAGQLDYDPHAITSSYSDTSSYVEIARSFVNRSGSDIIIREVGIIGRNFWRDSGEVRRDAKFLIARDVLPTPILVPNLATLTVRYRISMSIRVTVRVSLSDTVGITDTLTYTLT